MMEYQAIIKIGRSAMKVTFTDGSMNAMGTSPATYTTDNLMVQHAIENSDQFKRGRIRIVNTIDLDEEVYIDRNPKHEPTNTPNDGEAAAPTADKDNHPDEHESKDETQEAVDEDADDNAPVAAEAESSASAGLTPMEFDNNDDAKDFLESTFGYVRSRLRNRADIVAAGEANGISISFT